MPSKTLFLISLFLLNFHFKSTAQDSDIHQLEKLTTGKSASSDNINNLLIDNGKIWVGSRDGLYLYDGYAFTAFSNEKLKDIPENIEQIIKDGNNNYWCINFQSTSNKFSNAHNATFDREISIFNPLN